MKALRLIIAFLLINDLCKNGYTQSPDRGSITLHAGSLFYYNTYSLGYESPALWSKNQHQVRINGRVGGWSAFIIQKNKGILTSIGGTYLLGTKHCLEISSEVVFHFDKSLKGQSVSYIGALYRPFLGYRWQNPDRKIATRIGVGWYEIIQFGIGFRI